MRIDRAVFDSGPDAVQLRGASVLIALVFFFAPTPRPGLADERDSRAAVDFFERSVRPVLSASCQKCDGPRKQSSELRLDSRAAILKGGSSLHLLGFNHEQFTFRYAARDYRLTDVHGKVVRDIVG